jgi:hypothetical protein
MEKLPSDNLVRAMYPGAELRDAAEGTDDPPVLTGHFARFGEWAEIDSMFEGRFMEQIARGAFVDSLASFTPKVTFQHGGDPAIGDKVLGIPTRVEEDAKGAAYDVPLLDTSYNRDLEPGLRAGAYGSSFRFSVDEDQVVERPRASNHNPDRLPERTITRATVYEFGPVTFPAYAGATAGIRSLTDQFRPPDRDQLIAEMAREHPQELAAVIERALKGTEAARVDPKPQADPRFRTREEFLTWISKN